MTTTQWAYTFTYRIHGPGDTCAEPSGVAFGSDRLTEIQLQESALNDFLTRDDAKDNGWDRTNTVITRFHYTELEPVPVPDVSPEDGTVSRDESPAREDTDGV